MECVLAFDLGTSSVKASVYDLNGKEQKSAVTTYRTYVGNDGKSEQYPQDWWSAVCRLSSAIVEYQHTIIGIALSGHSMGVVPVDREGNLLLQSVPIWNDSRAVEEMKLFFSIVDKESWYQETGCGLTSQLYPLFKLARLRRLHPEIYDRTCCFLGTKDYINMKMTGHLCTDHSDASGSGAYSLEKRKRISDYFDVMSLDIRKMPEIVSSCELIGRLQPAAAEQMGLQAGIKVFAGGVDNACMCLGAGCFQTNRAYVSLGTSAWVAAVSDKPKTNSASGIYTFAHCIDGLFIPAVGILSAGSSQSWVMDQLFSGNSEHAYDLMEKLAQQAPEGANDTVFVPTLAGGNAVEPASNIKGNFMNISLHTTRADLCRAVYEGISCELALCYENLQKIVDIHEPLLITGGGTKSDFWMSVIAQMMGVRICRAENARNTATYGAAALALVGSGVWKDYSMLNYTDCESFEAHEKLSQNTIGIKKRFWRALQAQAYLNEVD